MILLVTGLVAVIVVILIAIFLSIRLGHADEDDEPELSPGGRERRRDQDERWPDQDTRRVSAPNRPAGRAGSARRRADGHSSPAPARERESRGRDGAPRRPARPDAPGYRERGRPPVAAPVASHGRYDTGPSRRPVDGLPLAGHPSGEFLVAGYDAPGEPRDRQESRRKPAAGPAAGRSRSRQRGKRGHDDGWPSTDWDTLSDEQYWAELSADKPLSSMARAARPDRAPAAMAPAHGSAKARPAPAFRPAPEHGLPSRTERADRRGPASERLPARTAARTRQAQVPLPPARREPDPAASPARPDPQALLDTGPLRDTRRYGIRDTGPLRDTGPYGIQGTAPRPLRDTGPRAGAERRRRTSTGTHAATGQDPALLASAPPPVPGTLEDDPLTSPSFSLKAVPATDTRSYGNARKHAKTTGPGPAAGADGSGSYPAADYTDPGYAYQAAPPVAVPPPAPAADRYGPPPVPATPPAGAQAPAYGNPYQYAGGGNGGPSGRPPGHLADPLRVYSPPGYAAQAPYPPATGPVAYQAVPAPRPAGPAPYADGYAGHPYSDQARYLDGYRTGAPVPGYEQQGYPAGPYAAGGYSPSPPQG